MIETTTREIRGRTWTCTQWSGSKNLQYFHELSALFAPSVAAAVPSGELSAKVNIAEAVNRLFQGLGTSQHLMALVLKLLASVQIDGRPITKEEFDLAFAGPRIQDLVPGLMFVLEANFGDFSGLLHDIMSRYVAQREKKDQSSTSLQDSVPSSEQSS